MSELGTFVMDRGWFEHPAFAREPFTEREAWAWLIAAAAVAPLRRRIGTVQVELQRGQFAGSIRFLGRRFRWSKTKVQRFLARLVTESMIGTVTESGVTVLTVCNYERYQVAESVAESPAGTAAGQVRDNSKKESLPECSPNGDGAGSAREAPLICEEAHKLTIDVMGILGIDTQFVPPGWCGAPHWFDAGLRSGWQPHMVRIAAAKVRGRRNYQPPFTFRYLDQPIRREHQLAANPPLPLSPVVIQQESNHAQASGQQPAADWRVRRDQQHAAFADLRAAREAAERRSNEGGGDVVRLVPNAGRR